MDNNIEKLYEELVEYQKTHGEDKYVFSTRAELMYAIGEYANAVSDYEKALEYDNTDCSVLFGLASALNDMGDLSEACIYYAKCASELKKQGDENGYKEITDSFSSLPDECRAIFDTVLSIKSGTYIFLSICGFGEQKQRYQNLAVALAQTGNRVIYVCPESGAELNINATEEELANYVLKNSRVMEGILVVNPIYATNFGVRCYNSVVRKLVDNFSDAVFLVSNINAYDSVVTFKGKNKIIFDCADDNSDFDCAFWSSRELFRQEQELVRLADAVTCTSVSLFLRKKIFDGIDNVYLSGNAVCAKEMSFSEKLPAPDDLKDIPCPRIMYIGCVYKRFDRDLFYELAKNNPDKSFVLVGSILDKHVEPIYDNIYFLGSKKHSELAGYYQNSDICIIPYFDDALMSMSCDPVKIHEHIAAKKPTITTFMPDTAVDRPMVYHANTADGFQKHIDAILSGYDMISDDELELYLTRNSWISRACQIMRISADKIYDYEKPYSVVEKIKSSFAAVKDKHSNFGIIYGISQIIGDVDAAQQYIEKIAGEYDTKFNRRTIEELAAYRREQSAGNISVIASYDCTGCTSCCSVCPTGAVSMKKDVLGFSYPAVDDSLCVKCGKCLISCPARNTVAVGQSFSSCYAVTAPDNIREQASSGGVFPVISQKALEKGYYVAGAVLADDFSIKHIVSDDASVIKKMYESKYGESSLGSVYPDVKKLLDNNNGVMFSGTPCQIAGLYSYLGKKYEKLITVSVVCHGVPSPRALSDRLKTLSADKRIKKLSFRNKNKLGWNSGVCIEYSDGSSYAAPALSDVFMEGFLCDVYLRESCYSCKYKSDVYSDIILGDFWGIEKITDSFDNRGVSYVSLNNKKAQAFFLECKDLFTAVVPQRKDHAKSLNPNIVRSAAYPVYRDTFIENYKKLDFETAYEKTFSDHRFDVAAVLWYSNNYGNAITNYALYKTLENMNKKVIAIDNIMVSPRGRFADFAKRHFKLSSCYFPSATLRHIINSAENFVVGSDQVWNFEFSRAVRDSGYFQLKFVPDDKNKLSYGSSFGQADRACEPSKLNYYKMLYRRFNHISTRDSFGVDVLKKLFAVKGECVLDPVFLLDRKGYEPLLISEDRAEKRYILAYILTPSDEKTEYAEKLREKMGEDAEVIYIIDAEPARKSHNIGFFKKGEKVLTDISPEEFVNYIAKSEFVITDSYHGTCFSVIFHKSFVSFVNRERERFTTFKQLSLENRILSCVPSVVADELLDKIDYSPIEEKLDVLRRKSIGFLRKSVK